jgi:hypothetical protein
VKAGVRRAQRSGRSPRRHRGSRDEGSALVEVVWLSLILLVPLVYILLTLVTVQRSAYGVTEAARAAGRAYVLSANPVEGRQRAIAAARVAMLDQGITLPPGDLTIVCHPRPASCLQPGSTVEIRISFQAKLPILPRFMGQNPASIAVSARHVEPYGSYREAGLG